MSRRDANDPGRRPSDKRDDVIDHSLTQQLTDAARRMRVDVDPQALLERLVAAAVANVAGARHAGITLRIEDDDEIRLETPSASDPLVSAVDQAQYETRQGPCLESAEAEKVSRTDELLGNDRWPQFAARAVALGIRSMLSVPLFTHGNDAGALNLYATEPGAFTAEDENVARMLGAHAAIALAASRQQADLMVALDSRDAIGQAKGILMERYKVDAQRAFDMLVYVSQRRHIKLRDLARDLAETGEI